MNRVSLSILILFLLTIGTLSTTGNHQSLAPANSTKTHQAGSSNLQASPTQETGIETSATPTSINHSISIASNAGFIGDTSLPVIGVFSNHYNTANFTDTSLTVGAIFSVQVNVTNAPLFNAYEFVLYYDPSYINATSYDLTTGTVFNSPFQSRATLNDPGDLRLAVVNLNTGNNNDGFFAGGSGMLANVTFAIVKAGGVSPLVLAAGIADPSSFASPPISVCPSCPPGTPNWTRLIASGNLPNGTQLSSEIQVATSNGYFRNVQGNPGPVASFTFSPANPLQGDTVTFNATSSFDPDNPIAHNNGILEYAWDFGDLSAVPNENSVFPLITHAYVTPSGASQLYGNFSVRLTVIDSDNGFQGMMTLQISIKPVPDEAPTAGFFFSPLNPAVGQDVTFVGRDSIDPDGSIATWTWNFGDGEAFETLLPFTDHVYHAPGNYTVTLTVKDSSGLTGSTSMVVPVHPAPQHDVAILSAHPYPSISFSGEKIVLEAAILNAGSNTSTINLTFYYNGKVAITQNGVIIQQPGYVNYVDLVWDTTDILPGNYTISATAFLAGDPTPGDNSFTDGQVQLLPTPLLTLTPSSGSVGTLVQVHGSGFNANVTGPGPIELEMTFDNQLVGLIFFHNSSFDFRFNVPVAQVGPHKVHALILFNFILDLQSTFTVTPTPQLGVNVTVGTIYFPGETVTIIVVTSLNGNATSITNLQVALIKPNGAVQTLNTVQTTTGIYTATYNVPTNATLGTYPVTVKVHLNGAGDATSLASFEVKPTWLSSNSRNITTGVAITGLVGLVAVAWQRGYFRKKDEAPVG